MSYSNDLWEELRKRGLLPNDTTVKKSVTPTSNKAASNDIADELRKIGGSFESGNPYYTVNRQSVFAFKEEEEDDIAPVKERTWFQKGALEDGYQFGDLTKTANSSVLDFKTNLWKGVLGIGEGVMDAGATLVGGVGKLFGADDFADDVKGFVKKDTIDEEAIARFLTGAEGYENAGGFKTADAENWSVFGEKSDSLVASGGQLAAQMGVNLLAPGSGLALMGVTSFGGEAENAFRNDASYGEAFVSSLISAGAEIITEKIGGISFGGKTVTDAVFDQFAKKASTKLTKALLTAGKVTADALAEGGEELISGYASAIGQHITYMKEKDVKELFSNEDALESFIGGFVLGGLGGGGEYIGAKAKGVDYLTGLTKNEEAVIKKEVENRVAEQEKNGKKLTSREKSAIEEQVVKDMERGYISTDTIESVLGGDSYKAYKDTVDSEKSLVEKEKSLTNEYNALNRKMWRDMTGEEMDRREELKTLLPELREKIKANESGENRNQLKSKLSQDVFNMVKGDRLVESYNEKVRANQDFKADFDAYKGTKHEEAARKTLENAIKAGANNTNAVHDIVDMAAKMSAESGKVFEFKSNEDIKNDFIARQTELIAKFEALENPTAEQVKHLAELKEHLEKVKSGKVVVNGNITGGNIVLNIDSATPLNRITGHEITHSLEKANAYGELQEHLLSYARSKGVDVDAKLAELKLKYEGIEDADPKAELVADLVGDYLFTDYDYVQSLATGNRNLAQRIYDEIKHLYKMATAGSKEARQLEQVKYNFEKAFREAEQSRESNELGDTDTKYSIREAEPPKETGVAYKVFFVKDGKLYPPMVANPDGADTPIGVWLDADVGQSAPPSKTGRAQVKAGGKGTQGGGGSLAFRPGWHLGDLPRASQFDRVNPETGKKELFPENFVWAEVEYAKDVDYQEEAMSYGYTENGKFRHAYAGLPRLPENGYYRYRTNPKPDTVPWIITGSMKVNRLLSDAEVNQILEQNGVAPVHRQGGDVELDKFGFGATTKPMAETEEVQYSLTNDTAYMDKAIAKNNSSFLVDKNVLTEAKAVRERIASKMNEIKDKGLVGLPEDVEGNTYIANSSYDGTEENTTICPRSLASEAFVDAVSEYLGRPLSVEEQIYISQDLQGRSLTPECTYCYVATDRKAYRAFLGEYIKQRDSVIQKLKDNPNADVSKSGELYNDFLNGRKDTKQMYDRFKMWADAYKNGKPMIEASHLANINKLMGDINSEFGAELKPQIVDAMKYAQSASWAKKRISYVAYNGHILNWKQDRINKLNSHYGLRMYSFSDFHPAFVLENMQMITDASVRGLKMLGYTKDIDFVEIFAPSGMNINVSTFGFESGGSIFENNIIGAEWEKAKALREKYPNVGITFVATNDNLVNWALEQDWIDVVIPYHLVRTGAEVAKAFNYTNYTSESSDTKDVGWAKGTDKKYIAPTEHNNDKATYLEALSKNHLKPRIERFIDNPNYMKLVNECRQPASESKPVQPVFNEEAAMSALAKLEANGYYQPIGGSVERMYEIAGEVAEAMTGKTQYSLSDTDYLDAVNRGDTATAQKMVDEAAKNAGYTPEHLYHGTSGFGFTKIDTSLSDDGISFFVADNINVAQGYFPYYENDEYHDSVRAIGKSSDRAKEPISTDVVVAEVIAKVKDAMPEKYGNARLATEQDVIAYLKKRFIPNTVRAANDLKKYSIPKDVESLVDSVIKANSEGTFDAWKAVADRYQEFAEIYDIYYNGQYFAQASELWEKVKSGVRMASRATSEDAIYNNGEVVEKEDLSADYNDQISESAKGAYDLYANHDNQLVIRGRGRNWNDLPLGEATKDFNDWWVNEEGHEPSVSGQWYRADTRSIAKYAKARGYRSVRFEDIYDAGAYGDHSVISTVYAFFNPEEDIKSADTVTYDDTDNVIPLSQRFNKANDDIRYSLSYEDEDIAPVYGYDFYGKDFRKAADTVTETEVPVTETVAPVNTGVTAEDEAPVDEATKRKEVESVVGNRDGFVSKKAMSLYEEVKGMKKGVRVSKELSYLLDTLDLSEKAKSDSYRSLRTALLNIRDNPNQVVNPNSAIESRAREMIGREYESMVEDFMFADGVTESIYKKMQGLHTELENDRTLREQSIADFDSEIARLQAVYDSKKNQNTKLANDLLLRIERNKRLKAQVVDKYDRRIEKLEARLEKMSQPGYKTAMQRKAKQAEYTSLMEKLVGDTSTWVDKKLGLSYKVNTLRRNLRDIVRDANGKQDIAKADAIYDELQGKYNHNEAELKRESMRIKKVFQEMKLNHAEDIYAHMLGEFRHNPDTKLTEDNVKEFYEKNKSKIDTAKVDKAIVESRKVFDELIVRLNERLREQGMKEIPYRQGYFPHFTNPKQKWYHKWFNWKPVDNEIPTSIAGLTEEFNPERSWQSFNKERKGDTTDYSLEQGLDSYIHGALDWIYHIEDIQKRRALENHIRYVHSDEGIKKRIEEIRNNESYDADEAQALIDAVYAEAKNPLNNFVTDLRAGTNTLANKKSSMDRKTEELTNRKIYSVMTNLNNRITANMVVGSFSSALTNFIPITQSWMEVSPVYSLKGMRDTIISTIRDDGIVNKSDFLTNRLMNEEKLYQTGWDKVADKAAIMMEAIDSFTSQTVWRSKYLQNISEGMSETEAIKNADQFAENVIAGRSRGNQPTIFDAKNPLTKIFTAFQLEVNNQYGYMFKDAPQDSKNKARLVKGYATAFLGAYAYNALYSSLVGRNAAFDPISILEDLFGDLFDDDEEPDEIINNFVGNVLEEVPFVGGLMGGGRIPLSSAIPYEGDYKTFITDIANGELSAKEMLKPLYYLGLPVGGGQIKKTNEGLGMFLSDHPVSGSYTESGNLRFPVENTPGNVLQAAMFGQYASKNARDYFDNGRSPLNEKQIQEYMDVDIPIRDYWEYREGLAKQEKLEEKLDYISGLDLPVAKKNILANNVSGRKDPINMESYGNFSSLDEFDFATNNPGKYAVSQVVGDYSTYSKYYEDINDLTADKDENGKSITGSRKEKVFDYINSLPLDYGQKCILFKSQYKADDSMNLDIIEYLNSREDIPYEEVVTILTELGFRVEGNNVYWD